MPVGPWDKRLEQEKLRKIKKDIHTISQFFVDHPEPQREVFHRKSPDSEIEWVFSTTASSARLMATALCNVPPTHHKLTITYPHEGKVHIAWFDTTTLKWHCYYLVPEEELYQEDLSFDWQEIT